MADGLCSLPLDAFVRAVAAREPVPGGGSVSAHVVALGAALGVMAARFTVGKKAFAAHAEQLAEEIAALEGLSARAAALVEADARAFEGVGAAMALPKASDEQKAARRTAMQRALREALEPPRACCALALDALARLDALRDHVTPHLRSDVAVGAHLLLAGLRGAWVNVLVNAGSLEDRGFVEGLLAEGAAWREQAEGYHAAIVGEIEAGLV